MRDRLTAIYLEKPIRGRLISADASPAKTSARE